MKAIRAGQLPDLTLKAGVDNLPVTGQQKYTIGQDFMTMRRIGIEQEWVSGDKRRLRSALAYLLRPIGDVVSTKSTQRPGCHFPNVSSWKSCSPFWRGTRNK